MKKKLLTIETKSNFSRFQDTNQIQINPHQDDFSPRSYKMSRVSAKKANISPLQSLTPGSSSLKTLKLSESPILPKIQNSPQILHVSSVKYDQKQSGFYSPQLRSSRQLIPCKNQSSLHNSELSKKSPVASSLKKQPIYPSHLTLLKNLNLLDQQPKKTNLLEKQGHFFYEKIFQNQFKTQNENHHQIVQIQTTLSSILQISEVEISGMDNIQIITQLLKYIQQALTHFYTNSFPFTQISKKKEISYNSGNLKQNTPTPVRERPTQNNEQKQKYILNQNTKLNVENQMLKETLEDFKKFQLIFCQKQNKLVQKKLENLTFPENFSVMEKKEPEFASLISQYECEKNEIVSNIYKVQDELCRQQNLLRTNLKKKQLQIKQLTDLEDTIIVNKEENRQIIGILSKYYESLKGSQKDLQQPGNITHQNLIQYLQLIKQKESKIQNSKKKTNKIIYHLLLKQCQNNKESDSRPEKLIPSNSQHLKKASQLIEDNSQIEQNLI